MKSGKVFLGVLAGAAIGAIAGILFAPDKGCNTRGKILNKGEDLKADLQNKFDELVETISNKYDSIGKSAENLVEKGKTKFDEVTA